MNPTLYTAEELEKPLQLPYEVVIEALHQGTVHTEHGLMRWGSNYTFLVTVEHNATAFLAIYKPRQGERPLWDFPDGTLCQRETAAFVLSELLGWFVVPPTVLRDASRGMGSVQVFIQHDPQRHYFTFDESHIAQLQYFTVFDAITNNADRKGGHCLLDEVNHIWGIDHGLTFNTAYKLRTVIWDFAGQALPDALVADLERLCGQLEDNDNPYTQQLRSLLSKAELRSLQTRVVRLLQAKIFPMPGPGPNRPWPAV